MKKIERDSNYELLRIFSMFFIVLYHVIVHGNVILNSNNAFFSVFIFIIKMITIVHVNIFIMLTGYFQSEKEFKFSKFWSLINIDFFYRVAIIFILCIIGEIAVDKMFILNHTSILDLGEYWFLNIFIFLYCLSPFLNKFIKHLTKSEYQKFVIVLFVIFSIIPYLTANRAASNDGFTLYHMIFIYFIGGYLRRYPLSESYLFKKCSKNLFRVILIFIFFICVIFNTSLLFATYSLKGYNDLFLSIYNNTLFFHYRYSNPIVIIQTISFFSFFGTLNIKSKFINRVSGLTLGVYLCHDNFLLSIRIYKWLGIDSGKIKSFSFIFYIFLIAIAIYVVGSIIEFIRQCIFKYISNRKISIKLRKKFNDYFRSIRFISD